MIHGTAELPDDVIGQFAFLPFGKEAVRSAAVTGVEDLGTGALGTLGNVI